MAAGPKPVSALPAYAQHLDVCLLCYAMDDYTKYIYPMKLHEYLAAGRPVVSVPIPALGEVDGLVTVAHGADAWEAAIACELALAAARVEAGRKDYAAELARLEAALSAARERAG